MKNILKIFCICTILCTFGCEKTKYQTCNLEVNNNSENYTLSATYKIYYNKTFVTKIEKEEKYISSDKNVIKYLKDSNELTYNNYKDLYGGFNYNIKSDKTTLNIVTNINMSEVNIKSMVKDKILSSDYVVSNKLTISGAKYYYKEKGAICDN